MAVHEDTALNPVGKQVIYGYAETKKDSVYVVPIDSERNTWIVQQYRYPVKQLLWECVAGHVEDGDSLESAARRELLEEAAVDAKAIQILGTIQAGSGIAAFPRTVCIARDLTETNGRLDESDGITSAKKLPLREVCGMIVRGEMTDATSIAAFMMVDAYLRGAGL